ncbi:MAG TPA: hypothetical protein VNO70_18740 [Blastocatellia bacterium]|nr:hypothetical protein [Blastocatellia bacterium]
MLQRILCLFTLIITLITYGCGGDAPPAGATSEYAPGSVTVEDLEKRLKFDSRVESFNLEDDQLVVNVNQEWVAAPPGMKERALGQWYGMLQAARSEGGKAAKGLAVIARHQGEEVARWTAEEGYKPFVKPKEEEGENAESE